MDSFKNHVVTCTTCLSLVDARHVLFPGARSVVFHPSQRVGHADVALLRLDFLDRHFLDLPARFHMCPAASTTDTVDANSTHAIHQAHLCGNILPNQLLLPKVGS